MTTKTTAIDENTKIIVIDGLIGAGKSTLVTGLHSYLERLGYRVVSCIEPVQQWIDTGILDLFYKDKQRYTYAFQTYTFVTRIQSILKAIDDYQKTNNNNNNNNNNNEHTIEYLILERSVFTDRFVFMKLLEKDLEPALKIMYASWFDLHCQLLPFDLKTQAHFVYLQTTPEEAMMRMNKRGRPEEVGAKEDVKETKTKTGVSLLYQNDLHGAHLEMFKTLPKTTILDQKLCAMNFVSTYSPGFQAIVRELRFALQMKELKEEEERKDTKKHDKNDCERSYLTSWDRLC